MFFKEYGFLTWDDDLTDTTYSSLYFNTGNRSDINSQNDGFIDMEVDDGQFDNIAEMPFEHAEVSMTETLDVDIVNDLITSIPLENSTNSNNLSKSEIEDRIPNFLKRVMKAHQILGAIGIYEMLDVHKGAILGDGMGLGMTVLNHYFNFLFKIHLKYL